MKMLGNYFPFLKLLIKEFFALWVKFLSLCSGLAPLIWLLYTFQKSLWLWTRIIFSKTLFMSAQELGFERFVLIFSIMLVNRVAFCKFHFDIQIQIFTTKIWMSHDCSCANSKGLHQLWSWILFLFFSLFISLWTVMAEIWGTCLNWWTIMHIHVWPISYGKLPLCNSICIKAAPP